MGFRIFPFFRSQGDGYRQIRILLAKHIKSCDAAFNPGLTQTIVIDKIECTFAPKKASYFS
jgi:hypothetical protein